MHIFISLIVGDLSPQGIRAYAFTERDELIQDLRDFYNDAVTEQGLDEEAPLLPEEADEQIITDHILRWVGRHVVIKESKLIT